jgi:CheY-like chemotaxis protein
MHQVLSVGADLSLLYTRSLVLEKAGASVSTATPEQALLLLDTYAFDLLVLCHSTHDRDMHELCRAARARAIKILLIESPTGSYQAPVDVDERFLLDNGPALLITTVNRLLAVHNAGELTPAPRLVPFVRSRKPGSSQKPPSLINLPQPQPDVLILSIAAEAKS